MPTVIKYKPARHSTLVWVAILTLISLALNGFIIFVLFQVRLTAKNAMLEAAGNLETLSDESFQYTVKINQTVPIATDVTLDEEITVPINMVVEHTFPIKTDVPFQGVFDIPLGLDELGETLPISTTIPFNQVITVPVNLDVEDILPATTLAPLGRQIEIPLELDAGQLLPVNSTVLLDENISIPISLGINEDFTTTTTLFGQVITVPISLDVSQVISASAILPRRNLEVPLNLSLREFVPANSTTTLGSATIQTTGQNAIITIPTAEDILADIPASQRSVQLDLPIVINQEFPIQTEILLDLPFKDGLQVDVDQTIPLDLEIPVSIPIETEVIVPIRLTVPIALDVPVVMDVPINIALSDTPFGIYLRETAERLRQISRQY